MKPFMDEDFLLSTPTAKELYHDCAAKMPILDYHCHIDPKEIAEDRHFDNITQVWLGGDHYKWRLMRAYGVDERYITGDAPDREKFQYWAETLEKAIGNPLYHWSHLELQRYFGYHGTLNGRTAEEVWKLCNEKLKTLSARSLIVSSGVTLLCTTDDPADDLKWHKIIKDDASFGVQVLPAWRPDKAMNLEKQDYQAYLAKLSGAAKMPIASFDDLKKALRARMDFFAENGCRLSDHGVSYVPYEVAAEDEVEAIFRKRLAGEMPNAKEIAAFRTAFLLFVGEEYAERGWAMQIHFGPRRDNNRKMYDKVGPDTGFDCMDNYAPAGELLDYLDALNGKDKLPKTILYSLDPNNDALIDSIVGCFQGESYGKLQHGSAWWFNDHKAGITKQLISFANIGLLGSFVGMLTDSRSFLSYPRHEYFRRILCELIGGWVENGEYPKDTDALTEIVKGISYNNAVNYFGFDLKTV